MHEKRNPHCQCTRRCQQHRGRGTVFDDTDIGVIFRMQMIGEQFDRGIKKLRCNNPCAGQNRQRRLWTLPNVRQTDSRVPSSGAPNGGRLSPLYRGSRTLTHLTV